MSLPEDMLRHIISLVVDTRDLCMLMRVNRWWRDEVARAEFAWERAARNLLFSLKHEDMKPPEGWYATVKRYASSPQPPFAFYDMSRDDYNCLLRGQARTSLEEYRISLAIVIDNPNFPPRTIFEWSAYAHEVFNNVGEFRVPVFHAGKIPRNLHRDLLNYFRVVMFVTRNFETTCLMSSAVFPGPESFAYDDVRGIQFGDGDAVVYLDADLEITRHDPAAASSFENNTDVALVVYFSLCWVNAYEDLNSWEESNTHIARFFELVMS
jgi:hypothetical protein